MSDFGGALARWAIELVPSEEDLVLARRSLLDTVAVAFAAREDPVRAVLEPLGEAGRWAALAHVLDYDDLHLPSTTHVSAVCVPVALATGGAAKAYLAGAGVMARLGSALGWKHYRAGWHATCTAGGAAAAVTASIALGLDAERIASAIALAVPASGGMQRAFGTHAKALQVGFVADAGVRAAQLSAAGASADSRALEDWVALLGGSGGAVPLDGPVLPGGLAVKPFPCCYALQRPISAVLELMPLPVGGVRQVLVRTPESTVTPLIHHRPTTGLEAKFSLEYGVATTLLDGPPGAVSFTDGAVSRPQAQSLMEAVETVTSEGGDHLLAGEVQIDVVLDHGPPACSTLALPPGAPDRPLTEHELHGKLEACAGPACEAISALTWESAAAFLRSRL